MQLLGRGKIGRRNRRPRHRRARPCTSAEWAGPSAHGGTCTMLRPLGGSLQSTPCGSPAGKRATNASRAAMTTRLVATVERELRSIRRVVPLWVRADRDIRKPADDAVEQRLQDPLVHFYVDGVRDEGPRTCPDIEEPDPRDDDGELHPEDLRDARQEPRVPRRMVGQRDFRRRFERRALRDQRHAQMALGAALFVVRAQQRAPSLATRRHERRRPSRPPRS